MRTVERVRKLGLLPKGKSLEAEREHTIDRTAGDKGRLHGILPVEWEILVVRGQAQVRGLLH